eukprot:scaffold586_cov155-Amphora_coffeaeformis.AAC.28
MIGVATSDCPTPIPTESPTTSKVRGRSLTVPCNNSPRPKTARCMDSVEAVRPIKKRGSLEGEKLRCDAFSSSSSSASSAEEDAVRVAPSAVVAAGL